MDLVGVFEKDLLFINSIIKTFQDKGIEREFQSVPNVGD
jgi:hypothetical protein